MPLYDSIVADVERAIEDEVKTRHDTLRSPTGRIAIDPSHLKLRGKAVRCLICGTPKLSAKHGGMSGQHPFVSAYGAPARRVECATGTSEPIPACLPNRDVARIVKSKPDRPVMIPMGGDAQMRRQTIGSLLRMIGNVNAAFLRDAAALRIERRQRRARLRHVNAKLGSASQRKRLGAEGCTAYQAERAALHERLESLTREHREIVRSDAYHAAVREFYRVATRKYDTRECVFGSVAA